MESISGLNRVDVIGKNLLADLPKETIEGEGNFKQLFMGAKESLKTVHRKELPITTPLGNLSYQTTTFVPIVNGNGVYNGMIIYVEEVSDNFNQKKTLFDELYRANKLSSFYSKDVPVVALRWSAEKGWPVEMVSDNISQYGYSADDFISQCFLQGDIIHPDDIESVTKNTNEMESLKSKYLFNEYRILDSSGNAFWVNEVSVPELDEYGNPSHYNGLLIDVNDRKVAELELLESNARIESILRATPVGMGVVSNRVFEDANDMLCEMLGYSREDFIGQSTRLIYPSDGEYDYVGSEKYEQISKKGFGKVETRMLRKDGNIIDVILSSSPIHPEDHSKGVTFTVLDITDIKNTQRDLEKYANELEKMNQIKDLFSDIIRHDLLSPAGIVRGYAEFLEDMEADETKLNILHIIEESNEKIIDLIESAAKYEKINSLEEIDYSNYDLVNLFRDVVAGQRLAIKSRGISVNVNSDYPCFSYVNPVINEVFVNLLSNAVKYSPENSVINIDFFDEGNYWKVTVTDQGDGISDEHKKYVFERFKRLDKKGIKGSGLGLAIVRRIVELHGGKYGVADNPNGKGSVFWVTLEKSKDNND